MSYTKLDNHFPILSQNSKHQILIRQSDNWKYQKEQDMVPVLKQLTA